MAFEEQLPKWENEGTEPPQSKQVEGWQPNEKPPASWFNWLFGRAYKVMQELQEKAETIDGAQAKADAAEDIAKQYTDQQIDAVNDDLQGLTNEFDAHKADEENPHNVTKDQVGLGNVDNVQQIPMSQKGQPNGVATLDNMGKVPSSQLPDIAAPVTSVNGKTGDVQLTASDVGAPTAQQHDQLEQKVDAHVANTNNPHGVTKAQVGLGNVPNYAMATKAQAEAGTINSLFMSPLRTKEAIDLQTRADSVVLGSGATTGTASDGGVVIGKDAKLGSSPPGALPIAIGNWSEAQYGGVAVGLSAKANGSGGQVAVGHNASASISGIALGSNSSASISGIALGSNSSAGSYGVAIGTDASSPNSNEGVLGETGSGRTNAWKVPGSFTVAGTKNFEIPHPHPDKKTTHVIRHGAVESPTAGDTLYRWAIEATQNNGVVTVALPDYFIHLNTDVQIFVTPQGHFGNGYGVLNETNEQLEIHCQFAGEYNVLVIGTRNDDHQSVQDWHIKGVEREIGESWTGETYVFEVEEILEVEEIKEAV